MNSFACCNCGHETNYHDGRFSILCQSCGCPDVKFSKPIKARPVLPGNELGKERKPKVNEPFLGKTDFGFVWEIITVSYEETTPPGHTHQNNSDKLEKLNEALKETKKGKK